MQLLIRTPSGKTITLEVEGSDTFEAKVNGVALESSLENGSCFPSTITKMQLFMRTVTGKTVRLEVGGSNTFKAKIKDIVPAPEPRPDNYCDFGWRYIPKPLEWYRQSMPLFVRILNEKSITLAVMGANKISYIMQPIMYKSGIEGYNMGLFLAGMWLDRNCTLDHYNIESGSTVDLVHRGLSSEISVETTTAGRKKIRLKGYPMDTTKQVKELIQQEAGIPVDQQRLVCAGEELQDNRALLVYFLQKKATLRLVDDAFMKKRSRMTIHIQISRTQKTIRLNVVSTHTIHDVKGKIEAQEGIPAGQQILFLPHKRLQEDAFTLAEYFIPSECTLYLAQILDGKVRT